MNANSFQLKAAVTEGKDVMPKAQKTHMQQRLPQGKFHLSNASFLSQKLLRFDFAPRSLAPIHLPVCQYEFLLDLPMPVHDRLEKSLHKIISHVMKQKTTSIIQVVSSF